MRADFSELLGKTIVSIYGKPGDEEIVFEASDGSVYRQYHVQDCCETVSVEEIVGDLSDVIGEPVLEAEEASNRDEPGNGSESWTWTFYKLGTIKGHVTIRWFGSSNGYYSEDVSFERVA